MPHSSDDPVPAVLPGDSVECFQDHTGKEAAPSSLPHLFLPALLLPSVHSQSLPVQSPAVLPHRHTGSQRRNLSPKVYLS